MNPSPVIPAASSYFDLEKGRQTERCEDCNADPKEVLGSEKGSQAEGCEVHNADPKEVLGSEKGSQAEGCEVHNADPKEVLVRLQSILYDGTLSLLQRS